MSFRIAIWLFFCFTINICSACECDNPPFYFMQNLKYEYVCHIKILKHHPSDQTHPRIVEGLTKIVILNGQKAGQILDTLLFINSSSSLCGQSLAYYPE